MRIIALLTYIHNDCIFNKQICIILAILTGNETEQEKVIYYFKNNLFLLPWACDDIHSEGTVWCEDSWNVYCPHKVSD